MLPKVSSGPCLPAAEYADPAIDADRRGSAPELCRFRISRGPNSSRQMKPTRSICCWTRDRAGACNWRGTTHSGCCSLYRIATPNGCSVLTRCSMLPTIPACRHWRSWAWKNRLLRTSNVEQGNRHILQTLYGATGCGAAAALGSGRPADDAVVYARRRSFPSPQDAPFTSGRCAVAKPRFLRHCPSTHAQSQSYLAADGIARLDVQLTHEGRCCGLLTLGTAPFSRLPSSDLPVCLLIRS